MNQQQSDDLHITSAGEKAAHFARGVCMGVADAVPGVSGGTIALLLGIYPRLVAAISHFDLQWTGFILHRRWREAAQRVDLGFLMILAAGIAVGLAAAMLALGNWLGDPLVRPYILAGFFGMVAASTWIVGRSLQQSVGQAEGQTRRFPGLTFSIGLAVAVAISLIPAAREPVNGLTTPAYWQLFLCGAVAICAMILPGISGALVLVLLGVYDFVVGVARDLLHGQHIVENVVVVTTFAAGCVVGLLAFSKLLRRLLQRAYRATMGTLCGLMAGSLVMLWPIQRDLTPAATDLKQKVFRPAWPDEWQPEFLWLLVTVLATTALTLAIDFVARRRAV